MEKNYLELGFRCGIEIHQQLEGKKLFCNCPTVIRDDPADFLVKRGLRAVAGETGKIDIAAAYEMEKEKEFIYQCYDDTTCLVETDEEPIHEINKEALQASLQIAKLLNAKIIDQIQVMRKTVVDGSNTSGFQRTALIAIDGYINTSLGKVNIPTICLEEEAAKVVKRTTLQDTYNLSRLGIPLIEIGTSADIKNPEHAKEVAYKIGLILRSTGKCRRGLGSIRQDVNISIKDGARTEIKGFQDYRNIPKVIDYEIDRQLELIKKGKVEPGVRKAEPDNTTSYLRPLPGAERMYPETDILIIIPEIKEIKIERIDGKISRYEKLGLSKELINAIIKRNIDIDNFINKYKNIKARFIAETLINTPKEIKRRYDLEANFENIDEIFEKLNNNEINKEAVFEILVEIAQGKKINFEKYKLKEIDLDKEVKELIKSKPGLSFSAYMGLLMVKHRGKVEGKSIAEALKKYVK